MRTILPHDTAEDCQIATIEADLQERRTRCGGHIEVEKHDQEARPE